MTPPDPPSPWVAGQPSEPGAYWLRALGLTWLAEVWSCPVTRGLYCETISTQGLTLDRVTHFIPIPHPDPGPPPEG